MKKTMMSCKEIVKTISSEEKINWQTQTQIRIHLFMCHHCRKYAKQLQILKLSFQKVLKLQKDENNEDTTLLKEKIIRSLKNR